RADEDAPPERSRDRAGEALRPACLLHRARARLARESILDGYRPRRAAVRCTDSARRTLLRRSDPGAGAHARGEMARSAPRPAAPASVRRTYLGFGSGR